MRNHNVLKFYAKDDEVKPYSYLTDFCDEEENVVDTSLMLKDEPKAVSKISLEQLKAPKSVSEGEEEVFPESMSEATVELKKAKKTAKTKLMEAEEQASELLMTASEQASEIISKAKEEADKMMKVASVVSEKLGYDAGFERGYKEAFIATNRDINQKSEIFLGELKQALLKVDVEKQEILLKYKEELKNLAIAVGEKVVQISLKSSGEVIERMIMRATEKLGGKEWAKIYIAKCDADLMIEADRDILQAISHLSEHVKVIVMENESPGTCIIELPDEIVDASANTQIDNIKGILANARF